MKPEHDTSPYAEPRVAIPRLFLREAGWQIARKAGSEREFCFMIAAGQDSYHRLTDGEIYVFRGDERLCIPCAARRGLLDDVPRGLRDPGMSIEIEGTSAFDYDLK